MQKEEEHIMTEIEAIRARHAVRNYTAKPLSPEIIDELSQEIEQCNRQGQLHMGNKP